MVLSILLMFGTRMGGIEQRQLRSIDQVNISYYEVMGLGPLLSHSMAEYPEERTPPPPNPQR